MANLQLAINKSMNRSGKDPPRRRPIFPVRAPGHPLYEDAQRLIREHYERERAERERVPTPSPSPTPPPSDPETDLATEEPYQLLLHAVQMKDSPAVEALLKRPDVKATLASKRSHRKAIPLLEEAATHNPSMHVLVLLLGQTKSLTSSSSTPSGLNLTRSMNDWPWVFRAALLSKNGGDVLHKVFMTQKTHERNLIKVFNVLISAVKELSPSAGARMLLNQTIHTTDRIFGTPVEKTPLDFTLNHYKILPSVTAFLVRNGADTSRIVSQSSPKISFLRLLFSPSIELAEAFWPSSSTTDGEERFGKFVAEWWDADWAYARETNTLDKVFTRWLTELERGVREDLPKVTGPEGNMSGPHYCHLEKRLIILGRHLLAKYHELGQLGGPEAQYRRQPTWKAVKDLNHAGVITYTYLWRPLVL